MEFSANFGVSQISNKVEMLGACDYANFVNESQYMSSQYDNMPVSVYSYRGAWSYREENGQIITNSGRYYASPEDYLNPGWRTDQYGNQAWV